MGFGAIPEDEAGAHKDMSDIPGIKAQHAIISDACRNKGDGQAFEEAVEILRIEYLQLTQKFWPQGKGAKFHLVLTVEQQTKPIKLAGDV